jgi:hypothetical protein
MTDQMRTMRDDLAFMRAMAAEGGQGSPKGGIIIAAGGFFYGGAAIAAWASLTGRLPFGVTGMWAPWLIATVAFYAVLFLAVRAIKRGASGGAGRLVGAAWMGLGLTMFSIILSAIAANYVTQSPVVWATVPSVFIAIYGAGWTVAASAARKGWMWAVAILSFVTAVGLGLIAQTSGAYLAYGAALMLLGGVPGLVLARRPA